MTFDENGQEWHMKLEEMVKEFKSYRDELRGKSSIPRIWDLTILYGYVLVQFFVHILLQVLL
ncbi:hypothetical protein HanHA300_Chr09g0337491 [Helianthus annuus]|nr:hypothetical protein HanHA300_Chr09g0337491 [Helianthus annuus]KAJ0544171.1 hypothetical protein HanHA89_Chr09g0358621 [Helianthus annuus]KAJ0709210.1 hypothetical protein HanLR1_Chr09g0337731 [Helianthus annuus]